MGPKFKQKVEKESAVLSNSDLLVSFTSDVALWLQSQIALGQIEVSKAKKAVSDAEKALVSAKYKINDLETKVQPGQVDQAIEQYVKNIDNAEQSVKNANDKLAKWEDHVNRRQLLLEDLEK